MKLELELVSVPVSDVDRAKAFYVDRRLQRRPRPPGDRGAALRAAHPARLGLLDRDQLGPDRMQPGSVRDSSWSSRTPMRPRRALGAGSWRARCRIFPGDASSSSRPRRQRLGHPADPRALEPRARAARTRARPVSGRRGRAPRRSRPRARSRARTATSARWAPISAASDGVRLDVDAGRRRPASSAKQLGQHRCV